MKRLRKLLMTLLSVVMLASFGMFAVACDSCKEPTPEPDQITIAIQNKNPELELGVKGKFAAIVEGMNDAIVEWSSSDPAVITVGADGAYEALALGQTTITASVKDKADVKDTVTITVKKSNVGNLYVSEDNTLSPIPVDGEFELIPFVLYGGEKIYEGIDFTFESSDETVFTVENGVITGVGIGDAVLTVSTTYRNDFLTISVPVQIVSSVFISISDANGNRNPVISTYAYQGIVTYIDLVTLIYEGGQPAEKVVTFTSSDESVATVDENGRIYAVSEGSAVITASFVAEDGATYSDYMTVNVQRPTISTNLFINYLVGDELALPEFTEADFAIENVVSVKHNNVEAFDLITKTLNKDVVVGSPTEYRELYVYTSYAIYTLNAKVTNAIIEDAEDLKDLVFNLSMVKVTPSDTPVENNDGTIKTSSFTYNGKTVTAPVYPGGVYYDGYVEFAADIDFGGEEFSGLAFNSFKSNSVARTNGFRGIIDGKGFTVSNIKFASQKGFIHTFGMGGVLRNLNFDEATFNGQGNGIAITMYDDTLIDNVTVKAYLNVDGSHSKYFAQGMIGTISGTTKIKNSEFWFLGGNADVVDSTEWVGVLGSLGDRGAGTYSSFFENVVVVSPLNKLFVTYTEKAVVNNTVFDVTNIRYCSNIGEYYVQVLEYALDAENSVAPTCTEAGYNVYIKTGAEDFIMPVDPIGHEFVVDGDSYKCATCSEPAIKKAGIETDLDKGLTAQIIDSTLGTDVKIVSAKYNAVDNAGNPVTKIAGVEDGKVSFATLDAITEVNSKKTYFVTMSNGDAYVVDFAVYSLLIYTEADLRKASTYQYKAADDNAEYGLVKNAVYGNYKVMADITITGDWGPEYQLGMTNTYSCGFAGTFDGNGHTISGLTSRYIAPNGTSIYHTVGALFQSVQGATIKNLNLVVDSENGLSKGGILGGYASGITKEKPATYENINIYVETMPVGGIESQYGLIFSQLCNNTDVVLKNVKFYYNAEEKTMKNGNPLFANVVPDANYDSYGFGGTVHFDDVELHLGDLNTQLFKGEWKKIITDESSTIKVRVPYALGSGFDGEVRVFVNEADTTGSLVETENLPAIDKVAPGQVAISELLTGEEAVVIYQHVEGQKLTAINVIANQFSLPIETGAYNYVIYTKSLSAYFITVNVTRAEMVSLAASNGDLKDGIDVGALFDGTAYADEVPVKLTIEDNFLTVENGIAKFIDLELAKSLPREEAYEAFIETESGRIFTTELTLWNLIVDNKEEFLQMKDYEYMKDSNTALGRFTFAKDVVIDMGDTKWTIDNQLAADVSGYFYAAFFGYIDGNGATIKNFEVDKSVGDADLADGGFIRSLGTGAVVKNINFETLSSIHGTIASRGHGFTLDNVTVKLLSNESIPEASASDGLLVSYICGNPDITLKDVTFIYAGEGTVHPERSALLGTNVGSANYEAGYGFYGTVYMDNVVVAGIADAGINVFNGSRYTKHTEGEGEDAVTTVTKTPFGLGNGAVKAEGAEVALTVYATLSDYENNTNACVVETSEFAPADKENANATLNLAKYANKGEKVLYAKLITEAGFITVAPMNGEIVTPNEIGEFTYYVTTDKYNFYKVTIQTKSLETIALESIVGDLKGVDVGSLFVGDYADYTPVTISFNEKAYPVNAEGIVVFDIDGANDARALASDQVQEILIATEEGQYFTAEMTLWSLILKTEQDVWDMHKYEYAVGSNTYGYYFFANDITVEQEWKEGIQPGRVTAGIGSSDYKPTSSLSHGFDGVIEGNNKTLTFARMSMAGGLVYNASDASIKNLNIVQTTGQLGGGLVAQYVSGNTVIENVHVTINGSFTYPGSGILVGALVYGSILNLKDVSLNVTHNASANVANKAIIVSAYNNGGFGFGYVFKGSLNLDNVVIYNAGNVGNKIVKGNVFKLADEENGLYSKVAFGLDNYVTGDVTFYAGDVAEDGWTAQYTELDKIEGIPQGSAYDITSKLAEGETILELYQVSEETKQETFKNDVINIVEEVRTAYDFSANSFVLPNEVGEYEFFIKTNLNGFYKVTVATKLFETSTIATAYSADLRSGINVTELLADNDINDTVATAEIGGVSFNVVDGAISFGEIANMSNDIKAIASEEAQSVKFVGENGIYEFTNVTIWSLVLETADDLFLMQSMVSWTGNAADGAFFFANDIDYNTRTLETYPTWEEKYRVGNTANNSLSDAGFVGYIEGNNATISNFMPNGKYGGLISNGTRFTIKNLNVISSTGFGVAGMLGNTVNGATLENVSLYCKFNYTTGLGVLFRSLVYSGDINLKDVTIKFDCSTTTIKNGWGFFGAQQYDWPSYGYTGKIYVDNVIIASGYYMSLVGGNYYDQEHNDILDFGSAVVKAEGAEKGITFYNTANFTESTTSYEATFEEVEATAYVDQAFDFGSILGEGQTFQYFKGNLAKDKTGYVMNHVGNGASSTYTFTEEGTYYFMVRSTTYEYYYVTVNVVVDEREFQTIDAPIVFDLKDGFDTADLLDLNGEQVTDINSIIIEEKGMSISASGIASFGDASSMSNEVKALALGDPKTMVVSSENGVYTYTNVTIRSIIISNANEMFVVNNYLYKDGNLYDGYITFDATVDYAERDAETYPKWADAYRFGNTGSSVNSGFTGVLDGAGFAINNFKNPNSRGGLIGCGVNYLVKNLTINYATSEGFAIDGVIGGTVRGASVENFTVSAKINYITGNGFLFNNIYGAEDFNLKNVTLKLEYTNQTYAAANRGLLGGMWVYTAGFEAYKDDFFSGKFVVDNVVIGSSFKATLVGSNYLTEKNLESVLDFGDGVVKAEGAEKGITFYNTPSFNETTTSYEATYEEVTAKAYLNEAFDFTSILAEGESIQYYKGSVGNDGANVKYSNVGLSSYTSTYTFTQVGTYKFAIRTAEYKFYVVTINVTDEVRINETIDTAYAFDLKDGIDTAKLLDAEGNALTGITGINYNGVGYTLNEGKVSFGAVAEMSNDVKALASATPRTLVVTVENGTYTYTNVTLWSLIVNDSADLRAMASYQTTTAPYKAYIAVGTSFEYDGEPFTLAMRLGNSGYPGNYFGGVIDGQGNTISKLSLKVSNGGGYTDGGLICNLGSDATIKNLNLVCSSTGVSGILGDYANKGVIENVNITFENIGYLARSNGPAGLLFNSLSGNGLIKLTNVTITVLNSTITDAGFVTVLGTSGRTGWERKTGIVELDNFSYVGTDVFDVKLSAYSTYSDASVANVPEYGVAFVKAEGAEKGITYYADVEAYTNGDGIEATTTALASEASVGLPFDFSALLADSLEDGEEIAYIHYVDLVAGSYVNMSSTRNNLNTQVVFEGEGTFYVAVRTSLFNHFIVTITAVEVEIDEETIDTAYAFDLKDGIDTTKLVDLEGNALENITSVTFNGAALSLTEGVVSFGDVGSMSDDTKLLASAEAKPLVVITTNGIYTYTNVTLWSLLVSDEAELRAMNQYQTSAHKGAYYLEADIALTAVETTSNIVWTEDWKLGTGIWQAFSGTFDGGNHTISNLSTRGLTYGGPIIGSSNGATIKNVKYVYQDACFSMNGALLDYSYGDTKIENVSVNIGRCYTYGGYGLLINIIAGGTVSLKDVTVITPAGAVPNDATNSTYERGIIAGQYHNEDYTHKYPEIEVDNLVIVGQQNSSNWKLFAGSANNNGEFSPLAFGNGVVLAEGAEKGITLYANETDYINGENAMEVTYTELDAIALAVGGSINVDTEFAKEGEAIDLVPHTVSVATGMFVGNYSIDGTMTFDAAGTYTVIIRDASYNYYKVTVTVA